MSKKSVPGDGTHGKGVKGDRGLYGEFPANPLRYVAGFFKRFLALATRRA